MMEHNGVQADPDYFRAIESMKSQLLIVLIRRLGGKITLPVQEIDNTETFVLMMRADEATKAFHFEVVEKGQGDSA